MKGSTFRRDPVASHVRGVPRSGIRDFFDIVSARRGVISLGIGEPDFETPWRIREASMYSLDRGSTRYTANLGLMELRREISRHVRETVGVKYDPATEILVTVGVSEALDLAVRAITEPGDEIIHHEPSYVSYSPVITFAHGVPVPVGTRREDGFRPDPSAVKTKITGRTRAVLLNFPTNPTGAVLERRDAEGLAKIAENNDLLVLTDEIYSGLVYDGGKCASIAAVPGMKRRTIYLNGFSKSWAMTGFRIGYACAPAPLIEAMMKIHQYTMLCAPVLGQKAAVEALRSGGGDTERMRAEYESRRNFVHSSLNDAGIPCHLPKGAFYAFPDVSGFGMSSKDFALRLLDEENVACVPGSAFGPSGEGYLRCSFATDMDNLKEAMKRMAGFAARHRGKRVHAPAGGG